MLIVILDFSYAYLDLNGTIGGFGKLKKDKMFTYQLQCEVTILNATPTSPKGSTRIVEHWIVANSVLDAIEQFKITYQNDYSCVVCIDCRRLEK